MRTHHVIGTLALIASITAGCGSAETQTIRGTLSIPLYQWGCGGDGYDDITVGTPATLTDADGTIVATATLGGADWSSSPGTPDATCDFAFDFPNVKIESDFYGVEVGHRGQITSSVDELTANGWTFGLTLGI